MITLQREYERDQGPPSHPFRPRRSTTWWRTSITWPRWRASTMSASERISMESPTMSLKVWRMLQKMPALAAAALRKKGYSEADVEKVMGGNFLAGHEGR